MAEDEGYTKGEHKKYDYFGKGILDPASVHDEFIGSRQNDVKSLTKMKIWTPIGCSLARSTQSRSCDLAFSRSRY